MKKTFSGFLSILLFGFGSVSAARAQVFAETGPPVVYVGQTWNTYVNFVAGDPSFCNSVAAANYVPQSCPGYWAQVVFSGDLGQGNVTTSSPCMGTFQPGGLPILEGGLVYKTAGTKTFTANVYSCTPSQPITGNIDGPPGILLGSWTTNLVVLAPPAVPPAPNNPPNPCSAGAPVLIDPVAANLVSAGTIVNSAQLGTASSAVKGAAADGVTQLLLQISGTNVGDSFTVQVLNENNQPDSTANIGGLFPIGAPSSSAANTVQVQAGSTSGGVMAFAAYISPTNFARPGNQSDPAENLRSITFQVSCTSGNSQASTASYLVRPPVVLIHGLWSSATEAWEGFIPQASQANTTLWGEMEPQPVDYSNQIPVTATSPAYSNLSQVNANALGFAYNAPNVLLQLNNFIHNYGIDWNAAAVQADVVAHSMGGDIARTLPSVASPSFLCGDDSCGQVNYNLGPIHKLITIGTPHTGTQLASDLLPGAAGDLNSCVRNRLKEHGSVSLLTAVVNGNTVDGAVGDMRATSLPSIGFPIAYMGATTALPNLSNLNASLNSVSAYLYYRCGQIAGNPLALLLTNNPSGAWNQEFSGLPNDGIVPLTSQLNGTSSTLIFPGVIHSPGIEQLDFIGPSELDPASGIPDAVINLLNEQTKGSDFSSGSGGSSGGGGGSSS